MTSWGFEPVNEAFAIPTLYQLSYVAKPKNVRTSGRTPARFPLVASAFGRIIREWIFQSSSILTPSLSWKRIPEIIK